MYYQRLSDDEIIDGFREGDSDIIREYFYGYCEAGNRLFDQRYLFSVDEFIAFAKEHQNLTYLVTSIGCGIAGFTDDEISPLFEKTHDVENIVLPPSW